MARRCNLTGKQVQSGNKVSHSNRKTRRRFLPNMQQVSFLSDALQRRVNLRVTVYALRTVDHNGGLDAYLLSTADSKLAPEGIKLKREIKKAVKANSVAA